VPCHPNSLDGKGVFCPHVAAHLQPTVSAVPMRIGTADTVVSCAPPAVLRENTRRRGEGRNHSGSREEGEKCGVAHNDAVCDSVGTARFAR
jgi:hypothetical protein